MESPCLECERLRRKVLEAAEVNVRAVSIWKDTAAPVSDGMLTVLRLNLEVEATNISAYMQHVETVHRMLRVDHSAW